MNTKKIDFRDPIVERVVDKFVSRSDVGFSKYGRTLDSERVGGHKDLFGYLNDVQEELMDAILYIQTAKEALQDEHEAFLEQRAKIIAQNGNSGLHYSPCAMHDKETEYAEENN